MRFYFLSIAITCIVAQENPVFPHEIVSLSGELIPMEKLARNKTVCIITVKSAQCPVCREQLVRIKKKLHEFSKCNLTFLVLAPGDPRDIHAMKKSTEFPFPFISNDQYAIAEKYGLVQTADQLMPAVFILNPDLSMRWIQRGRSSGFYSDKILIDYLDCSNWI